MTPDRHDLSTAIDKAIADLTFANSPAMAKAIHEIRLSGIRAARRSHFDRVKLVEVFKADPQQFWGYINLFRATPLLSTGEAIEFWANEADHQRTLRECDARRYRYDPGKLRMAAERVLVARYFRRFGSRIWSRRAA